MAKKVAPLPTQMRAHIDEYGWCRANQHTWSHPSGSGLKVEKGIVTMTLRCSGCGTTRHDDVALKTGDVVNRTYKHAEGYIIKVPKGQHRPRKNVWRKEHFGNILKGRT